MRQLELDLWWHDSDIWKDRHSMSSVHRPCENAALDNVFYESKTYAINYDTVLSGLELRIFELELRSLKPNELPRWYTDTDRQKWIAKQSNMPMNMIKSILDNVSYRLWQVA